MSDKIYNYFNVDELNEIFPTFESIIPKIEYSRKNATIPKVLYHYTCIDAFISIMQNRNFWISNIRYMNDSQEFINGKTIFKNVIQRRLQKESPKVTKFLLKLLNLCENDTSNGFLKINSKDIFSLSFCTDGDILTQWQCYGNEGISIGFYNDFSSIDRITFMDENQYNEEIKEIPPNEMKPHDELIFFVRKVIYNDEEKKQIFNQIIDVGIKSIEKFNGTIEDLCIDEISDVLFYYFAIMKDEHFSHEQEIRFLHFTEKDDQKIHFRKKGKIILPYLKQKILNANCRPHDKFPVSDIVIAPGSCQEFVAESVKYFLAKSGYEYLVDKVRTSKITYRSE